jgi:hypothetical protein
MARQMRLHRSDIGQRLGIFGPIAEFNLMPDIYSACPVLREILTTWGGSWEPPRIGRNEEDRMQKFLLASAAIIGIVGTAAAEQPAPVAPATIPVGITSIPSQPTPYLGGNNLLNSNGAAMPQSPSTPTPGTVVVHLNGRIWFYVSVNGNGSGDHVGVNKNQPLGYIGYARLYPGFDALATNGLRYGGILEIRQNFSGASAT